VSLLLGIESSCDETAAAVVSDGRVVHSSVVDSQIALHRPHGGVVPEIASRRHVEVIGEVVREAVRQSGFGWGDIEGIAATRGPGLASSLLVGWSAAKGLALRLGVPLCAVNHVAGHIHSVFLDPAAPERGDAYPFLALAVSGGHTALYRADGPRQTRLLARTVDDAAGEALDKASKLLGLGYPGGPVIDRLARDVAPKVNHFPATHLRPEAVEGSGLDPALCFSFSGLKTSLLRRLQTAAPASPAEVAALASEYQEAVVEAIVRRVALALRATHLRTLAVGGGVSLNSRLRERLAALCSERGVRLLLALPRHCGDNAAMIAGAAGAGEGVWGDEALRMDVDPSWEVGC
jgi:N6-L-threonylcarbamoyladenine synthase